MSLLAGSPTHAAVYALDDSATIVHGGIVAMQWRSATPGPRATPSVDGRTLVSLALNTQRWAGKRGRIYMALAPQPVRCEVRWTTRGMTLPGRIEPGQRVLVFEGIVPGPTLNDTLEVSVSADGRELQLAQRLRFSYEIEVLP
ncbi:MAG TPA: hypothetical protein VIY30_18690 [Burkholderiaceae bacterium]